MFPLYKVEFTPAHNIVFLSLSLSGMRSVFWTTVGGSYEPLRSVTSTKTPVSKTTGWPHPSCTATRHRGCLWRCVSLCVTVPACARRHPPAERHSPCTTNRPTRRGNWRGPGLQRWGESIVAGRWFTRNCHVITIFFYFHGECILL